MNRQLILASGSPRRKEMFDWLGLDYEVIPSDFDEASVETDDPEELVEELALQKALVVARDNPDAIVVGADSIVSLDDHILGKPEDAGACQRMILKLAGKTHQVFTGYAIINQATHHSVVDHQSSDIFFRSVGEDEVEMYLSQAHWQDKAGGYAIQEDPLKFVTGYDGSYTNIVGLPILRVCEELISLEVPIPSNYHQIVEEKTGQREV